MESVQGFSGQRIASGFADFRKGSARKDGPFPSVRQPCPASSSGDPRKRERGGPGAETGGPGGWTFSAEGGIMLSAGRNRKAVSSRGDRVIP